MAFVPQAERAIEALRLVAGIVREADGAARFRKLIDSGAPLFRTEVDRSAAVGAFDGFVRYEPSDALREIISAVPAVDR